MGLEYKCCQSLLLSQLVAWRVQHLSCIRLLSRLEEAYKIAKKTRMELLSR